MRPRRSPSVHFSGAGDEIALDKASDAGQDLVGGFSPDEGFRISLVNFDKFADGGLQILYAAKHAPANPFIGECGEPALD